MCIKGTLLDLAPQYSADAELALTKAVSGEAQLPPASPHAARSLVAVGSMDRRAEIERCL
jgi:hypothetical protein